MTSPFLDGVISPSTAHEITPIHAFRVNVANAAPCAWHQQSDHFIPFYISSIGIMILTERANCVVCVTVVWRVLDEHQVVRLTTHLLSPYCQGHHYHLNHYHLKHHHLHHHDHRWDPQVPPVHFEPTTPCGSHSRGGVVFLLQVVTCVLSPSP